jgi:hypothetical protein
MYRKDTIGLSSTSVDLENLIVESIVTLDEIRICVWTQKNNGYQWWSSSYVPLNVLLNNSLHLSRFDFSQYPLRMSW